MDPPTKEFGRQNAVDFAARTEKNLRYILRSFENHEDVHVVTHVVVSALGLFVFPYEYAKSSGDGWECITRGRLEDRVSDGWPPWEQSVGASDTMEEFLRHLRNAVSHRRIQFSSDSRQLQDTYMTFRDGPKRAPSWEASIRADQLLEFVRRFANLLDSCIG